MPKTFLTPKQINEAIAGKAIQDFTGKLPLSVHEYLPGSLTRVSILDRDGKLIAAIPDCIHEFPEVFAIGIADAVNELYGFKK